MGYTTGRRFTNEELILEARKYKTKKEIYDNDSSLIKIARNRGILKELYAHIDDISFSTPQLICKKILEEILGMKCLYNTRKIVKPYELDIYFEEFKLAFEYNGTNWHISEDVIIRDCNKKELCKQKNITLIDINQISKKRLYEEEIKYQLIEKLDIINFITNRNITNEDINKVEIIDIYKDIPNIKNLEELQNKIKTCKTIKEFQNKYSYEYRMLCKSKQLFLLNSIKCRNFYNDEELLLECGKIKYYNEFITKYFNLYSLCIKRNLLEIASKHMIHIKNVKKSKYYNLSNEELLDIVPILEYPSHIRKIDESLFLELKRRNLYKNIKTKNKNDVNTSNYYKKINTKEFYNLNIKPFIIDGKSLNEIVKNKLIPISLATLKKIFIKYADEIIKTLEHNNCKNNTLQGLLTSPYRKIL